MIGVNLTIWLVQKSDLIGYDVVTWLVGISVWDQILLANYLGK